MDYYESFIKEFDRNKIVLVVNDIPTKEIERKNNFSMIVENFEKKKKMWTISYLLKFIISINLR